MADEDKHTYGMESSSSTPDTGADDAVPPSPSSAPRAGRPIEPPSGPRESLPLEGDADADTPMSMRSVRELDVCPNCGANMTSANDVVCLRCGFDLKTMKQVKTAVGQVEVGRTSPLAADGDQPADAYSRRKPLVIAGMGGTTVPLIAAAVAGAILAIGYLAGVAGLYPPSASATGEIAFGTRMFGLLKMVISVATWTGSGLAALTVVALLNGLRLGDVRLAGARMLGVVAVMHLARFMSFSSRGLEWTLESITQALVFAGLSMVLFNLKPKDTPILVGMTICVFLAIWLSSLAIVWGAGA